MKYEFFPFIIYSENPDMAKNAADWLNDRLDYLDNLDYRYSSDYIDACVDALSQCEKLFLVKVKY